MKLEIDHLKEDLKISQEKIKSLENFCFYNKESASQDQILSDSISPKEVEGYHRIYETLQYFLFWQYSDSAENSFYANL